MKLPDYAKAIGISYTTAWRWWKAKKLPHPARKTEKIIAELKDGGSECS